MADLVAVARTLKRVAADLEAIALNESLAVTPRLLIGVEQVMEQTGMNKNDARALIHRAGRVNVNSRLVCRPADLDRVLEELREEGATG